MSRTIGPALRCLTLRGRCLLAAGATAAGAGLILQERDLLRVAVLVIAVPLVALALTTRSRFRLTCSRRIEPARLAAGERARVRLRIENVSRLPTGLLLVEDSLPYLLGGRPRVVVDRLAPRRPVDVGYQVSAAQRGRYRIGPLTVRMVDPFGLCELPRSFTSTDLLVVTPKVVTLPPVRLAGEWGGVGQNSARAVATSGDDDVATREYREGDELRRIHWRTTARRGELTVRREEQPWQSRGAVLLDTRVVAHRGDGPGASLEWAMSAAASVAIHLVRMGIELRVVTDAGTEITSSGLGDTGFEGRLLDLLAVTSGSGARSLRAGLDGLRRHGNEGGLLVAVLGALSVDDAEALARLRTASSGVSVALLLDSASWVAQSPQAAAANAAEFQHGTELLTRAGWRTIVVRRGDALEDLWPQAGRTPADSAPQFHRGPAVDDPVGAA